MKTIPLASGASRVSRSFYRAALALLLLAALATAFLAVRSYYASLAAHAYPEGTSIAAAELEDRFGLRLALVGLTAGGGILDLRFRVVDPVKAAAVFEDHERFPALIAEADGTTLRVDPMSVHLGNLAENTLVYIHYPNARNAVEPGSNVTLVIGDVRVEHLPVQ